MQKAWGMGVMQVTLGQQQAEQPRGSIPPGKPNNGRLWAKGQQGLSLCSFSPQGGELSLLC